MALLQESGLTKTAFARREKLSPQTLNKWKIHFPGKDDRRQLVCGAYSIKGRILLIHLLAEQISWLHWVNIFTTKSRRHQDVAIVVARSRSLKNPWPAGLLTSHPPVAVAPLFPPLPPVQISTIDNPFPTALCLCAVVVKIVTAAAHPFPLLPPVNKFVESMEP